MPRHIFISYSRSDAIYVKELSAFLTGQGLPVWLDDQIPSGDRWDRTLRERIDACAAFVLVMTPAAEDSSWVGEEVDRARAKGKPVLPLLLAGEVFFGFSRTQFDDVSGGRMPGTEFVDRLRELTGVPVADGAPAAALTLLGHTEPITGVAFSPDSRDVATAGRDATVRVWSTSDGSPVRTLRGHAPLLCVAYSGTHIAAGGESADVQVFGERAWVAGGHVEAVRAVCFAPGEEQLATGDDSGVVRLWEQGVPRHVLTGGIRKVYSLAYSPDGSRLAVGDAETVRSWNPHTGAQLAVLPGDVYSATSMAYSPDGRTLATAGDDGMIRLWRPETRELLRTMRAHSGRVYSIAYSPDGEHIASGGLTGSVRIWRAATGELADTLDGHTGRVFAVAYSPDGRLLATGSGDKSARLWPA